MKKILFLLTFCVLLNSCTQNDELTQFDNSTENRILKLSSQEQKFENKIEEIILFKKNQEIEIVDKILSKKNLKMPTESEIIELQREASFAKTSEISEDVLKNDLEFYHKEKLKAIYLLRKKFNFTSIQSIADEIESLKLLNPEKAKILFEANSAHLKKHNSITSTIYNNRLSEIIDVEGKIILNDGNIPSSILNAIKDYKNQSKKSCPVFIEGVVNVDSPIIGMSYHAGVGVFGAAYDQYFTQFGLYVIINGQPIAYPSLVYHPSGNSSWVTFISHTTGNQNTRLFPQGFGSILSLVSNSFLELQQSRFCPEYGQVDTYILTPIGSSLIDSYGYIGF